MREVPRPVKKIAGFRDDTALECGIMTHAESDWGMETNVCGDSKY